MNSVVLLLYSKYSLESKKFLNNLEITPISFIQKICIDNERIRALVSNGNKIKIHFVPCILIILENGIVEKYEGGDAFLWFEEIKKKVMPSQTTQVQAEEKKLTPDLLQKISQEHIDSIQPDSGLTPEFDHFVQQAIVSKPPPETQLLNNPPSNKLNQEIESYTPYSSPQGGAPLFEPIQKEHIPTEHDSEIQQMLSRAIKGVKKTSSTVDSPAHQSEPTSTLSLAKQMSRERNELYNQTINPNERHT